MTITLNGTAGVTFPAGGLGNPAGAVVGTTDTQTLTNKTLGSGLVAGASLITLGTLATSTSGTSIDFTGIPSWVKRVTVSFVGVSISGTANIALQLGSTAGGIQTTGYGGSVVTLINAGSIAVTTPTTYAGISAYGAAAASFSGAAVITKLSDTIWSIASNVGYYTNNACAIGAAGTNMGAGNILDRVRITTSNGTDTFDAGSINILYE